MRMEETFENVSKDVEDITQLDELESNEDEVFMDDFRRHRNDTEQLVEDSYTDTFVKTFRRNYNDISEPSVIITNNPPVVVGKRTLILPIPSELPEDNNVLHFPKVR